MLNRSYFLPYIFSFCKNLLLSAVTKTKAYVPAMNFFSRKLLATRYSLTRLVFSIALPLVLVLVFLAKQILNLNDTGLSNGFSHPLLGWDHLVTMLAVGIWAAQLRGRAIWMLPLAFVSVMSLGGLAGASGIEIPHVDGIILLSCAVFSILISRKARFTTKINILIVAFFAFFHGFAHGQEISTSASLISYTIGFMLATLLLHGAGILVAKLVVLAISCLLSVLFSSAALAKTSESFLDSYTFSDIAQQYYEVTHTQSFKQLKSAHARLSDNTSTAWLATSNCEGGVSINPPLGAQPPILTQGIMSHSQPMHYATGDALSIFAKHVRLTDSNSGIGLPHFFASYSSDCRNLDFKTYYPKINHTPGRQLLSNGVGLTSPPNSSLSVAPRLYRSRFDFSAFLATALPYQVTQVVFWHPFSPVPSIRFSIVHSVLSLIALNVLLASSTVYPLTALLHFPDKQTKLTKVMPILAASQSDFLSQNQTPPKPYHLIKIIIQD
jgi:urease accessory protein